MDFDAILGQVGNLIAGVLDVLAWPAVQINTVFAKDDSDGVSELLASGLTTLIVWGAALLGLQTALERLVHGLETSFLAMACRNGNLKSVRHTVRAVHLLCRILRRTSSTIAVTHRGVLPDPDEFGQFSAARRNPFPSLLRFLVQFPVGLAQTLVGLGRYFMSWKGALLALIVVWAEFRPSASFWTPGADLIGGLLKLLGDAAVIGWIPLVLLFIAIASTARVRGAYAWRTDKFKQAHAVLDGLAHTAERPLKSLGAAIEGASDYYSRGLTARAARELTSDRGYWKNGAIVFRTVPSTTSPRSNRLVSHRLLQTRKNPAPLPYGTQFTEHAKELRDRYRQECLQSGLSAEVRNIAPRSVRKVLWHLKRESEQIAQGTRTVDNVPNLGFSDNTRMLTSPAVEAYLSNWLDKHSELVACFESLPSDAEPDQRIQAEAKTALADFTSVLRQVIIQCCWVEEDLRILVKSGWEARYPTSLKNILQSMGSR